MVRCPNCNGAKWLYEAPNFHCQSCGQYVNVIGKRVKKQRQFSKPLIEIKEKSDKVFDKKHFV